MRELYYLVSAAVIATMVAAFAVPASAQPFSSVMGSWLWWIRSVPCSHSNGLSAPLFCRPYCLRQASYSGPTTRMVCRCRRR